LNQAHEEQYNENGEPSRPSQLLRFDEHRQSLQRPTIDTNIEKSKSQPTAQTLGKQSVLHAPPVKDLDPAADRLAEDLTPLTSRDFYTLMGMREPTTHDEDIKHLAVPHGLFSKMVRSYLYVNRKYKVFAIAVYVFLVLQLIIGAVFIVLGALTQINTHITIAVLGAVSTVIAGGLALMQGQGLPNRLRVSRDALRSVVFEAQELYWDKQSGRTILYKDVKKIREDYLRVVEEMNSNRPDNWNSVTKNMAEGPSKGGRVMGKKAG
jgi:hypothetical protein